MANNDFPMPTEGFVITHFLTVSDIKRSVDFYARVFDGKIVMDDGPGMVKIGDTWIIVNTGGGPTDDKPTVHLAPPADPDKVSQFLNVRVANMEEAFKTFSERGATFLTEPVTFSREIRCYMRDPDGYIIEVGQII